MQCLLHTKAPQRLYEPYVLERRSCRENFPHILEEHDEVGGEAVPAPSITPQYIVRELDRAIMYGRLYRSIAPPMTLSAVAMSQPRRCNSAHSFSCDSLRAFRS